MRFQAQAAEAGTRGKPFQPAQAASLGSGRRAGAVQAVQTGMHVIRSTSNAGLIGTLGPTQFWMSFCLMFESISKASSLNDSQGLLQSGRVVSTVTGGGFGPDLEQAVSHIEYQIPNLVQSPRIPFPIGF